MILEMLVHRGRSTMREIADAVGRTESTVRDRVAGMEMRGVVIGYEARVDWGLVGLPVTVMVEAYCPPDKFPLVTQALNRIHSVVHSVATTGSRNVFAIARTRDMDEVRKLLGELAGAGLLDVHTSIALESLVDERQPGLTEAGLESLHGLAAEPHKFSLPRHATPDTGAAAGA